MTLIVAAATFEWIVHVSDRRVTRAGRPYDPHANKTIIFEASDGVFAASYSGAAYIDRRPTDAWIAERIYGEPVAWDGDWHFMSDGCKTYTRPIGRILQDLGRELAGARVSLPIDVLVSGWQFARKRRGSGYRPVMYRGGSTRARFKPVEGRYWYLPRHVDGRTYEWSVLVDYIGHTSALAQDEWQGLAAGIASDIRSIDGARTKLVDAIRMASSRSEYVGADVMSVSSPTTGMADVGVSFHPAAKEHHIVASDGSHLDIPVSYSPWILGRSLVYAPTIISGGTQLLRLGRFSVELTGPRIASGVLGLATRQPRRAAP